jgi:hypothetical protein
MRSFSIYARMRSFSIYGKIQGSKNSKIPGFSAGLTYTIVVTPSSVNKAPIVAECVSNLREALNPEGLLT